MSKQNTTLCDRIFELNRKENSDINNQNLLKNENTNIINQSNGYNKYSLNNIGEITGNKYFDESINYKMPLRSAFNAKDTKKNYSNKFIDPMDTTNKNMNFDVSYFDVSSDKYSKISETNNLFISDPIIYINNINLNYNCFLLENIINLINENRVFLPYNILIFINLLYISSTKDTETTLKNYFNFPGKDVLFKGFIQIQKYISKSDYLNLNNFIFINNKYEVNTNFINYIKNLANCYFINIDNYKNETKKINSMLNKNIFNEGHIKNLNMILLTVGNFNSIWNSPFEIIQNNFYSKTKRIENMLYSKNKNCNYYEDDNMQLIELFMHDNLFVFGIILGSNTLPILNDQDFSKQIKNCKYGIIEEIMFPKFSIKSKIRISSLLQKTGLDSLFTNLDISEFIKDPINLSDFLQNITIDINEKYIQTAKHSDFKINTKFIANKPFLYYLRCLATDTIIISGQYY
jgi:hypothetical protein